jgi:hypothetical protein
VVVSGLTEIGVPAAYPVTNPYPIMVKLKGAVPPVMATLRLVDCPEQMEAVGLDKTAEVGENAMPSVTEPVIILGVQNPFEARTVNTSPFVKPAVGKFILNGPAPVPGNVNPVGFPLR